MSNKSDKSSIATKADHFLNQKAFSIASYAAGGWALGKVSSFFFRHKFTALLALAGATYGGGYGLVRDLMNPTSEKSIEHFEQAVKDVGHKILDDKKDQEKK